MRFISSGLLVVLIGFTFFTTLRPAYAGRLAMRCGPSTVAGHSLDNCRRSIEIVPGLHGEVVRHMRATINNFGLAIEPAFVTLSVDLSQELIATTPLYARNYWTTGLLTDYLYRNDFGDHFFDLAVDSYSRLLKLVPGRVEARVKLSDLYLTQENFIDARTVLLEGVSLHQQPSDGAFAYAFWPQGLYWNLALVYSNDNDYRAAVAAAQVAVLYGFNDWLDNRDQLLFVLDLYRRVGDTEAVNLLEQRLEQLSS